MCNVFPIKENKIVPLFIHCIVKTSLNADGT